VMVGSCLFAVALLLLLVLALVATSQRHRLVKSKCLRRCWRGKRRRPVDGGGSERSDREQSVVTDETYRCLLDPTTITPCTFHSGLSVMGSCPKQFSAVNVCSTRSRAYYLDPTTVTPSTRPVTTTCAGGIEFYLAVVTPDSAAGDCLSPSSASSDAVDSGELVAIRSERREVGDGSTTTCYDDVDLVTYATLRRDDVLTGSAWNCERCTQCDRRPSSDAGTLPTSIVHDQSSNHRCSWTSCSRDRRIIGATPIDKTVPRCCAVAPCIRSRCTESDVTHDAAASTSGSSSAARRPRSWCSSCMHVDNRLLYSSDCACSPADVAEQPRVVPRCSDATGSDRRHMTSVDRRCRRKAATASSRVSLQTN